MHVFDGISHGTVTVPLQGALPADEAPFVLPATLFVDLGAALESSGLQLDGPLSLLPTVRFLDADDAAVVEVAGHPMDAVVQGGVAQLLEATVVTPSAELLAVAPRLAHGSGRLRAIRSRHAEPTVPPAEMDNSDKEVDHVPVAAGNVDLHRPLPTAEELVEILGGAYESEVDALLQSMEEAEQRRDALLVSVPEEVDQ